MESIFIVFVTSFVTSLAACFAACFATCLTIGFVVLGSLIVAQRRGKYRGQRRHPLVRVLAMVVVVAGSGGLPSLAFGKSPYDAARNGDLDALRQYRFEGIDLFTPDARGFIPYELAALHADPEKPEVLKRHVETMLWLKEYKPENHRYGKATIKLIQTGLEALGYAAGRADGFMGKKTAEAIRAYQKDNELAETGRPGPQWLGMFYQDVLKDAQFKLTKLGFDTQGTDGLMGPKTRKALLRYRQEKQLSTPHYLHLDALLLGSVDHTYQKQEDEKKAAIAEKAKQQKQRQTRYVQAGLRALGYRVGKVDGAFGSKTANGIKAFQKKYRLPVSGDVDKATYAKMQTLFVKDTQRKLSALGYRLGKADGQIGKKTTAAIAKFRRTAKLPGEGITAALISTVDRRYDNRRSRQMAKKTAKTSRSKRSSKKTSKKTSRKTSKTASKTAAKSTSSQKHTAKKTAQQAAKKTAKKSTKRSTQKPRVSVNLRNKKNTGKQTVKKPKTTTTKTSSVGGRYARGRMRFNRKNGRVIGCQIASRGIPIEWCEPFYPLPRNNHCEATFKSNGKTVINLWCK